MYDLSLKDYPRLGAETGDSARIMRAVNDCERGVLIMSKIFVNQMGYLNGSKKRAIVPANIDGQEFSLVSPAGEVVYRGKFKYTGYDCLAGDETSIADFSDVKRTGIYQLKVADMRPCIIKIGKDVYDKTFIDLNRAFYYLRCGMDLECKHAGRFTHKKCHSELAMLWDDNSQMKDVSGGWHDAGDYGRYVTPGACALSHLLYAYVLYPQVFEQTDTSIPKTNAEMADILNECRYELEWFLKMQNEDGSVYHKATTARHAPFVMPEDDTSQMYILPVSSMATADFAAICAMASGLYRPYDESFADILLIAAKTSGEWLINNPDFLPFKNPQGCGTGEYGEWKDLDNRFWAFAELYAATKEEKYKQLTLESYKGDFSKADLGYGSVGGFGTMALLFHDGLELDDSLVAELKKAFVDRAEELANNSKTSGYGVSMIETDYCWGSNMIVMKQAMTFAIADRILGKDKYKRYVQAQIDYLLGLNALGFSYVSGSGEKCLNFPHLRPAFADGIEECIPGMVSGGPNRRPFTSEEKSHIPEGTPPMKSYADIVGGFSVNEITIYWNSPAVFAMAYLLAE